MVVFWFKVKKVSAKAWDGIKAVVGEQVQSLIDKILGFREAFISLGKGLIQGIIDGMGKMLGAIIKKAAGLARAALEAIKNLLNIGSPSKVMLEIGVNMIQGMVLGIDKMGQELSNMLAGSVGDSLAV